MDVKGKIFVNARAIIERIALDKKEIIVQWRNRSGEECWEFPGGSIEPYESLYDAVRREVKEETGLDVVAIGGQDEYFQEGKVECLRPFSVYQTLEGFVDSVGFHFICHVVGDVLAEGDASKEIRWVGIDELKRLLEAEEFSSIDKVAALRYLKDAH